MIYDNTQNRNLCVSNTIFHFLIWIYAILYLVVPTYHIILVMYSLSTYTQDIQRVPDERSSWAEGILHGAAVISDSVSTTAMLYGRHVRGGSNGPQGNPQRKAES